MMVSVGSPTSIVSFQLSRRRSSRLFTLLGQVLAMEFTCSDEVQVTAWPRSAPLTLGQASASDARLAQARPEGGRRLVPADLG